MSKKSSASSRLQQFVRSNLVETITVTIASSFLLTGVSAWNVWKVYQGFQGNISKQFEVEQRSGEIRYYDEVLTASAQMAAQTGNPRWKRGITNMYPS
jgi:methyl-accepting chemotaxis protein PixJ